MNTKKNIALIIVVLLASVTFTGCKKQWLEEKPNKAITIPNTIEDLQALNDNYGIHNFNIPAMGHYGDDDYYVDDADAAFFYPLEINAYKWAKDVFPEAAVFEWSQPYERVYYSNLVLEGLKNISETGSNRVALNNARGSALFYRSFAFYNLLELFAKTYDPATAASDPGIPLKLSSDINKIVGRSSVVDCYDKVLADLNQAAPLLPASQPTNRGFRPTRQACFALLSRISLIKGDYTNVITYADSSLKYQDVLLDFSQLDPLNDYNPVPYLNAEVILNAVYSPPNYTLQNVDTLLYRSYDDNDLRKSIFFMNVGGLVRFKGNYCGDLYYMFAGLSVNEVYFNKIEALARTGRGTDAMTLLNTILPTRWKPGTFVSITAPTPADILPIILTERRKELLFRSTRWTDLKRLNKEPGFARTLQRKLNGDTFTLAPNSLNYVYPIPLSEIQHNPIEQNPRN